MVLIAPVKSMNSDAVPCRVRKPTVTVPADGSDKVTAKRNKPLENATRSSIVASSTEIVRTPASSSRIVAVPTAPRPPEKTLGGGVTTRSNVSATSRALSPVTSMFTIALVCPGKNVATPDAPVKSDPSVAVPFTVLQAISVDAPNASDTVRVNRAVVVPLSPSTITGSDTAIARSSTVPSLSSIQPSARTISALLAKVPPPVGLKSSTSKNSSVSSRLSLSVCTVIVLTVSPGAKVRVPSLPV